VDRREAETHAGDRARPASAAVMLGLTGGFIAVPAFAAITGAACGEGLVVGLIVGLTASVYGSLAGRRGIQRRTARLIGLSLIGLMILSAGGIGRLYSSRLTFQRAFGEGPAGNLEWVKTMRFGYMDNTSLLIMRADATTMEGLLERAGFSKFSDAEEWLTAHEAGWLSPTDAERMWRSKASVGGIFADELPFHADLRAFHRDDPRNEFRMVSLIWDPRTDLAYVYVIYH
jgi:hypothetical protein